MYLNFEELAKLLPEAPTFIEIWLGTTRKFAGHPERKHRIAEIWRPHVEVSGSTFKIYRKWLETQHLPSMVNLPKTKLANFCLAKSTELTYVQMNDNANMNGVKNRPMAGHTAASVTSHHRTHAANAHGR